MNPGENDEVTRISQVPKSHEAPPFWAGQPAAPAGSSVPAPRQQRPGWLVPAIAAACAIIIFAAVLLLTQHTNSSTSTSSPSTPAAHPSGPASQTSPVASSASTAPAPSTAATTATSSSVAAFPAGSVTTCGGGPKHPGEAAQPLEPSVRVHSADAYTPSCDYVGETVSYVRATLASNPTLGTFSQPHQSHRNTSFHYTDSCLHENRLTTCRVLGSSPHNYVVYVQDNVG